MATGVNPPGESLTGVKTASEILYGEASSAAFGPQGSVPAASDIVFPMATAVNPPGESLTGVETASEILFGKAPSPSFGPQGSVPAASNIFFPTATAVNPPGESLIGVETASEILFGKAPSPSFGPQGSVPAASNIFFPTATAVNPPRESLIGVETAAEILFGKAPSPSFGPQGSVPVASNIFFPTATAVNPPRESLIGVETASEILFGKAPSPSFGPQGSVPAASNIFFPMATAVNPPGESLIGVETASKIVLGNGSRIAASESRPRIAPSVSDIQFGHEDENVSRIDPNSIWGYEEIRELFRICDSHYNSVFIQNDTYISLRPHDLNAFKHVWKSYDKDGKQITLSKAASKFNARIDLPKFVELVQQFDVSIDTPNKIIEETLVEFVRYRVREGGSIGNALFRLLIKHGYLRIGGKEFLFSMEEIRGLFDLFDLDHDGYITVDDLRAFMLIWSWLNFEGQDDIESAISQAVDPYGRIDFASFITMVRRMNIEIDSPRRAYQFLKFARRLVNSEFAVVPASRKFLIRYHIHYKENEAKDSTFTKVLASTKELEKLFNAFDDDGDGRLTSNEVKTFVKIWEEEDENNTNAQGIKLEVDSVWDGKIDFWHFLDLLQPIDIELIRRTKELQFLPLLKRIFNLLDDDGDGRLTSEQVETFLCIWKIDPKHVQNYVEKINVPENGDFDFADLFKFLPLRMKSSYLLEMETDDTSTLELKYFFNLVDEDQDGSVSAEEVRTFTRMFCMMPFEAQYILDQLDADNNERFNFPKFVSLLPAFKAESTMHLQRFDWHPLQNEMITQLNHLFCKLDKDQDGQLTTEQVQAFKGVWKLRDDAPRRERWSPDFGTDPVSFPELLQLLYSRDDELEDRTQDQKGIARLIKMFCFLDEDRDGCLTSKEVEKLILVYMYLEQADILDIMAEVNSGHHEEGKVDFPSLLKLIHPKDNKLCFRDEDDDQVAEVMNIFRVLDAYQDGFLPAKELETFAQVWISSQSAATTLNIRYDQVDADGNGTIDFPQFFHMLCCSGIDLALFLRGYNLSFEEKRWFSFSYFQETGPSWLIDLRRRNAKKKTKGEKNRKQK